MSTFQCNICGYYNDLNDAIKHRELFICEGFKSCARFRGVVWAVQRFVLGESGVCPSQPLASEAAHKNIRGIGMSDSDVYAKHLSRIFDYANTFYDAEPILDITDSSSSAKYSDLDFIISSDILEYIFAPVSSALKNIYNSLKPGGYFVVTAPYLEGYETIEHFPHLSNHVIASIGDDYFLINKRLDGFCETFGNLNFHGGLGSVLEMRIFGEGDLFSMLRYAGFRSIEEIPPENSVIGYEWADAPEMVLAKGRLSKSYVIVCKK